MSRSEPATQPAPLVHLLWTGGWDSTFRLLHLLHDTPAVVQPWHLILKVRPSLGMEIRTMQAIREELERLRPEWGKRILPTRFRGEAEMRESTDDEEYHQMERLRTMASIGYQYRTLARMARMEGLEALELSVQFSARPSSMALRLVRPNCDRVEGPLGPVYRIKSEPPDPDMELFRPFSFPVLDWTKKAMAEYAEERGLGHVLDRTWFCHRPRGERPCGMCGPCTFVLEEGLGHRLPLGAKLRNLRMRAGWKVRRFARRK